MSVSINFNGIKDVEILQTTFTSSNSRFETELAYGSTYFYYIKTILPWTQAFLEQYAVGFVCTLNY